MCLLKEPAYGIDTKESPPSPRFVSVDFYHHYTGGGGVDAQQIGIHGGLYLGGLYERDALFSSLPTHFVRS